MLEKSASLSLHGGNFTFINLFGTKLSWKNNLLITSYLKFMPRIKIEPSVEFCSLMLRFEISKPSQVQRLCYMHVFCTYFIHTGRAIASSSAEYQLSLRAGCWLVGWCLMLSEFDFNISLARKFFILLRDKSLSVLCPQQVRLFD